MDRAGIHEFLREVVGPNVRIEDHAEWVSFPCILSQWTHTNGIDRNPSAGISINEDGHSIYNCYACNGTRKGPLTWLLRELDKYTGESHRDLILELDSNEFLGGSLPEWGVKSERKKSRLKILDKDEYLDLFDPAEGHWYLKDRGITRRTARQLQLLYDSGDSAGIERIVFPVFTPKGELVGFTGRAIHKSNKPAPEPRVRDYFGLSKEEVLLGAHLILPEDTYVVVVEGLFDYAMMVQYGYPAVASMHSGLTAAQIRLLQDIGKPVVLMFDNDEAGDTATDDCIEKCTGLFPLSYVRYPVSKKGAPCGKDPATLTAGQVDRMLEKRKIA